jgi:deoxycytidylate deaminase
MGKHLDLAIQVAQLSQKKPRVGCVIVKKRKVISLSCNLTKSHPLQKKLTILRFDDEFLDKCKSEQHAEFAAIISIKNKDILKGASIYIARLDSEGNTLPGFPCPACYHLITKYGIKNIFYT